MSTICQNQHIFCLKFQNTNNTTLIFLLNFDHFWNHYTFWFFNFFNFLIFYFSKVNLGINFISFCHFTFIIFVIVQKTSSSKRNDLLTLNHTFRYLQDIRSRITHFTSYLAWLWLIFRPIGQLHSITFVRDDTGKDWYINWRFLLCVNSHFLCRDLTWFGSCFKDVCCQR